MSINYDPNEELSYFNIIVILLKKKKYAEVIKMCELLLEFSPSSSIYDFMANSYFKLGQYGKALKAVNLYKKSCSRDRETDKFINKICKEMLK